MKQQEIQTLIDRYLDGETTNDEERRLRQYFAETQLVPPEWRPYKALFAWEQREARQVCCDVIATHPHRRHRRLAIAASLAALLLVGAGVATTLLRQPQQPEATRNYAVIDGHVTTDAARIAQEAEEALTLVATTEEDTFEALNILEI